MSTSFDINLGSDMDRARMLLGDTGVDPVNVFLYQNETIQAQLSKFPFSEAVAQLAMGLATRYAQQPDWYDDEGGTRARWQERVKAWWLLVTTMRSGDAKQDVNYSGVVYGFVPMGTPPDNLDPCNQVDLQGNALSPGTPGLRF